MEPHAYVSLVSCIPATIFSVCCGRIKKQILTRCHFLGSQEWELVCCIQGQRVLGSEIQAVATILPFFVLEHWPQPCMCAGINTDQLAPASALTVSLSLACPQLHQDAGDCVPEAEWQVAGLGLEHCTKAPCPQRSSNPPQGTSPAPSVRHNTYSHLST